MPPLYCRPSQNVAPNATWSVTAGAADALYPVTKVNNRDPADPTKSTGAAYTIRATFASAQTIEVVQFLMHNLGTRTITITNNAGLNTTLIPAANYRDGYPEFSWLDLRDNVNNSASQWTFAMTVASGIVHVGEIVLWEEARFLPLLVTARHGARRLSHTNVTDWGYEHLYNRAIRERTLDAKLIDAAYRDEMFELEADAVGRYKQWPLILYEESQDSYWVRFVEDLFDASWDAPTISDMKFTVQETGMGLAP